MERWQPRTRLLSSILCRPDPSCALLTCGDTGHSCRPAVLRSLSRRSLPSLRECQRMSSQPARSFAGSDLLRHMLNWAVADLLGHASITTAERYDIARPSTDNPLSTGDLEIGGPPGDRTQDTVIKSHVLYH